MGFYGNLANVARTTFSFDKTYSTRWEMMLECKGDQVFIGRYVLLDYDHEDSSSDDVYNLVKLVQWIRENHSESNWDIVEKNGDVWKEIAFPENKNIDEIDSNTYYIVAAGEATFQSPKLYLNNVEQTPTLPASISDWYNSHYYIDKKIFDSVGRGWDSTVWQKTYKDDDLAYVMIAELNGVVPTIDLTIEPPVWLPDDELKKVYTENLKNGENKTYNASWDGTNWVYSESGYTLDEQNIDLQGDYILLNNDIYVYNYLKRQKYTDPYFDEEDKTNLYYLLHMHRPWRFGLGTLTGIDPRKTSSNNEDNVSISYSISGTTYPYNETNKVPPTTAPDTMNFNFNFPSIGKALKNINDLLYGEGWNSNVDPWNKDNENSEINYNKISFYPDFNTSAFNSVAGALNSLVDLIGHNIVNAGDEITNFPAGNIYYGSYINLTTLNDVTADDVIGYTPDNSTEDSKNRYWYQYYDKDFGVQKYYYRELIGYPSYNDILLSLHQNAANALDTVDDLRRLAEGITGIPGTLLVTDDDYRIGGLTLNGNNPIIVDEQFSQGTEKNNYLPYPVDWCSVGENGTVIYDVIENLKGLKFEINNNDKSFSVSGTATENVELIIAANVYLPIGEYILSGSIGGSDLNNNIEKYGLKAIKNNGSTTNEYKVLNGDSEIISVTSPDFYFNYVKVFINKDVTLLNQQFYPMIRKSTASSTYYPYANEYTLNISHKEVENAETELSPVEETSTLNTLYQPTVDNYGHVTKLEKKTLPNYFSSILLKEEDVSNNTAALRLSPESIGDVLNLTTIDGMNFIKKDNKIIFKPEVSLVKEKTTWLEQQTSVPVAGAQDQVITEYFVNPNNWDDFNIINNLQYNEENNDLICTYRTVPYPITGFSVNPRPTTGNGELINFDWDTKTDILTPIFDGSVFYPVLKTFSTVEDGKTTYQNEYPEKIISFAPADDIIKIGVYEDSTNTKHKNTGSILIGHKQQSNELTRFFTKDSEQTILIGEIDNLFYRQSSRISELVEGVSGGDGQDVPEWRTHIDKFFEKYPTITEKINLTKADDTRNGIFSTLSLKVDKFGHIAGLQKVNIKLIFNNIFNNFMAPKKISPFVTKYFHNEPVAENGYGYGAYCIGDKIYLNANESIYNYLYIGVRSGVTNLGPGGSGIKMDYFSSAQIIAKNPIQIMLHCNAAIYMLTLMWFRNEDTGTEYFEVIGNTSFYVNGNLRTVNNNDGTVDNTFNGEFRATQGVREYSLSESSNDTRESTFESPVKPPFATVSSDQDTSGGNRKSWLNSSNAWLKVKPDGGQDKDIAVYSPYDSSTNKMQYNAAKYLRAVNDPAFIGIRQILGIGNLSSLGVSTQGSDVLDEDIIEEETINQEISHSESEFNNGDNDNNKPGE